MSAPGESYAGEDFFGGAVYLFARDGDDWQQRARLTLDPQQYPTSRFAYNLALSEDGSLLAAGDVFNAVFVYSLDGGQVLETQVLPRHPDEDAHRAFAQSLSLTADGDLLLVGAMEVAEFSDSPISVDFNDGGAVYAYRRLGGQWQRSAVIEGQPGDGFGSALAVSAVGNRLAVAAVNDHSTGSGVEPPVTALSNVPSGAVYVYRNTGTGWQQEAFIKPTNNAGGFLFGQSLALSAAGSRLAVGAPREPAGATGVSAGPAFDEGSPDSGAGYMFLHENGAWRAGNYLKSPETACGANFGAAAAFAVAGQTLVMSAVPGTPPQLAVDGTGEAAFGFDTCPGQVGEPPLHGAVYLY